MKNTILTSIFTIAFALPAMGAVDIPKEGSSTCDSSTLKSSSGNVALEADWSANTIDIAWDGNGGSTPSGGAATCTYDSQFALPTKPSRTGYTFAGWAVKINTGLPLCNNIDEDNFNMAVQSMVDINYYGVVNGANSSSVVLTEKNTWAAILENGAIVKGKSSCASVNMDENYSPFRADSVSGNETDNGWCVCKATSFISPNGEECATTTEYWIDSGGDSDGSCLTVCSHLCAFYLGDDERLRAHLLNVFSSYNPK